jgi:hypothetical protein
MIRLRVLALALTAGATRAAAQPATHEIVVLTSFPKELFEAYNRPSSRRRPG